MMRNPETKRFLLQILLYLEVALQLRKPLQMLAMKLAWHLYRVQDHHISDLLGLPQLWVADGWHTKFGMAKDEKETGTGHSPAQVEALQVDSADLPLGYADAVYERAKQYLATVKPADLDAAINEPQYDPLPTVGVRLVSIISDNIQHAGQVMYVRGLLERQGWLGV